AGHTCGDCAILARRDFPIIFDDQQCRGNASAPSVSPMKTERASQVGCPKCFRYLQLRLAPIVNAASHIVGAIVNSRVVAIRVRIGIRVWAAIHVLRAIWVRCWSSALVHRWPVRIESLSQSRSLFLAYGIDGQWRSQMEADQCLARNPYTGAGR